MLSKVLSFPVTCACQNKPVVLANTRADVTKKEASGSDCPPAAKWYKCTAHSWSIPDPQQEVLLKLYRWIQYLPWCEFSFGFRVTESSIQLKLHAISLFFSAGRIFNFLDGEWETVTTIYPDSYSRPFIIMRNHHWAVAVSKNCDTLSYIRGRFWLGYSTINY